MPFDRADLIAFLRAVDGRLTRPGAVRLIGGAVIGLAYVASYRTHDIDYVWADREVDAAIKEIAVSQPALVRALQTGVYFAPDDYEDRLEVLQVPGLVRLAVVIPERHDLAIMKIARGEERDIEAIAEVHAGSPFSLPTLVERFASTWVTGDRALVDAGFRCALSILYGEGEADDGMRLLARRRAPPPRGRRRPASRRP
jgi:hypothetical protein